MKKKIILFSFLLTAMQCAFAQKENNIWCFGKGCGVNFNSGVPVSFSGDAMSQQEGSSSIADTNGNLLFYTDGVTVWNKNNVAMPNGQGLYGNASTTQSALIIQKPGSSTLYYVFTADAFQGAHGFNYSIVDMTLQGGLGDVRTLNTNILPVCDERIAAVRNANGKDIWVIATTQNGDIFKASSLTAAGFSTTPVSTTTGIVHSMSYDYIGYLKSSSDGKKLAMAIYRTGEYDVYDFNNATGLVSNPIVLSGAKYKDAYGVEFSSDVTRLYGAGYDSTIYQFDLTAGSATAINNSAFLIRTSCLLGALQLAPDGKIYVARQSSNNLGIINDPSALGALCNYVDLGFQLTSGTIQLGLPNSFHDIVSTNLSPLAKFSSSDTVICAGSGISFSNLSSNATSYQWSFPGGTPDTSTLTNPSDIIYNTSGVYNVQLVAINGSKYDTLLKSKYIVVNPSPNAGTISASDDSICEKTLATLSVAGSSGNIQWQSADSTGIFANISGATSSSYSGVLVSATSFRVIASIGSCTDTSIVKSVIAVVAPSASFIFTNNGLTVTFTSKVSAGVTGYSWDFGDSTAMNPGANPIHQYAHSGTHEVCLTVKNSTNCNFIDCQNVTANPTGINDLNSDTTLDVYPTVFSGSIVINAVLNDRIEDITLCDVQGRKVLYQYCGGTCDKPFRMNTSGLSAGMYFITIKENNVYYTKKIVKQ